MVDSNKWSGEDIITFLDIFQNYPCLRDASTADYINRNAKDSAYKELLEKLGEQGLKAELATLKKKIKSLRDKYRNEVYKIKKSKSKSGAGAEDVYKPRLVWFSAAEMFWSSTIVGRDSSSNLDNVMERALQNEDFDSPFEDTADVLSVETPANSEVRTTTPSPSERKKNSTPPESGNEAAKRSPGKMLPPSRHLKLMETTSGSKKPQTRFEKSVEKLQDIAKIAVDNEDQFDKYGKYIARQLREMPLRNFITLQSQINHLITTERLHCFDADQEQCSMQRSQSPYSGSSRLTPQLSPYSGSSRSTPQLSPYSQNSSDKTPRAIYDDDTGGLDILSQAMVGMCDEGNSHANLINY